MNKDKVEDAEFAEISAEELPNEEFIEDEPIQQNEINTTAIKNEKTSFLSDKIANYVGMIFGIVFTTTLAGLALAIFLTFIPGIKFTFLHFIKCWSGVLSGLFIRGILKTKF